MTTNPEPPNRYLLTSPGLRDAVFALMFGAYVVMWIGGMVTQVILRGKVGLPAFGAPLFLLLGALLVVIRSDRSNLRGLLAAAGLGFVSTVLGLYSGYPFGHFTFTESLYPHLLGVPVVMACLWLILIAYVQDIATRLGRFVLEGAIISATWIVAIDLVVDPVASGPLGFWRWTDQGSYYGIPVQSFAGWMMVGIALVLAMSALNQGAWCITPWARYIGFSIVLLFTLIAIASTLWLAGAIGVGLIVAHLMKAKQDSSRPPELVIGD